MTAYIHTKHERPNGTYDCLATIAVDHRINPMRHHEAGLSWTASGYGKRIPTQHMVKFNGRWRRVYCCVYSNIGTLYIGNLKESLIVDIT